MPKEMNTLCDIFTEKDGTITIMTNNGETVMVSPDRSRGWLISIVDFDARIHQWPEPIEQDSK